MSAIGPRSRITYVNMESCDHCHEPCSNGVVSDCDEFFHLQCLEPHQQETTCDVGVRLTLCHKDSCASCLKPLTGRVGIGVCNHLFHENCLKDRIDRSFVCPTCSQLLCTYGYALFERGIDGWMLIEENAKLSSWVPNDEMIPTEFKDFRKYSIEIELSYTIERSKTKDGTDTQFEQKMSRIVYENEESSECNS